MARLAGMLGVLAALAAGCGGANVPAPAPAPTPTPSADPPLAREEPAKGEILLRGDYSPMSHGPYEFDGRYAVSYEQYAPEDPKLDFGEQTSFVVMLDKAAEIEGPESIALFGRSRRTGRKLLQIHGRYFVDVSFGDFPYVIRFTPRR